MVYALATSTPAKRPQSTPPRDKFTIDDRFFLKLLYVLGLFAKEFLMRLFFLVSMLFASHTVLAQTQIEITSKEVVVRDSQAVLVRTNRTPNKVKVTFEIPMD